MRILKWDGHAVTCATNKWPPQLQHFGSFTQLSHRKVNLSQFWSRVSLSFLFSHKMTGSSLESDQYREQTFSREQRVNLQMLETRLRADRPQWAYQHRLAHHVFVFGFVREFRSLSSRDLEGLQTNDWTCAHTSSRRCRDILSWIRRNDIATMQSHSSCCLECGSIIYLHYCFFVCLRANRLFPNVWFLLRCNIRSD